MAPARGATRYGDGALALDDLFARAETTPDADLAPLFERIAAALSVRIKHEERLVAEQAPPMLLAVLELHQQVSNEVERMRSEIAGGDSQAARQLVGTLLPLMVKQHLQTVEALLRRSA